MSTDINDIIIQDFNESDEIYNNRKKLTLTLLDKNNLNHITAVTCARLLINKMVLDVTYDVEVENLLSTLL
jgi:hypothetical protein